MRFSASQSIFITLAAGVLLARNAVAEIDCFVPEVVNRTDCTKAISQIVYSKKPKDTLDRVSNQFAKLSGNCTIIVRNPDRRLVTKKQIEDGFNSILNQCAPSPGRTSLPNQDDINLEIQDHQVEQDTDFFAPEKITCGLNHNAPLTLAKDCKGAFKSIATDSKGRMLSSKNVLASKILKTYQNCTIEIYTTDSSLIIAKKKNIEPTVSRIIKDCKGKSGVIGLKKGGNGNNGLTVIKIRNSKRCGSRVDSEGQFCA